MQADEGRTVSERTLLDLRSEPRHVATLAEWHQAEWAHLNPGETLAMRVQRMQTYLGEAFVPTMFICKVGDALAGSSAVVESDMTNRMNLTPWLASVYVAPDYRRKGIGAALVRHTVEETRRQGFSKMYLYTPDEERFYQGLGWSTLSQETYLEVEVAVMEIDLALRAPRPSGGERLE
jgi:GNAT superfamily N-acetyltransferase